MEAREMSLSEVACQYGLQHRAAREYTRIANAVRTLDECAWWQWYKKFKTRRVIISAMKDADEGGARAWDNNGKVLRSV